MEPTINKLVSEMIHSVRKSIPPLQVNLDLKSEIDPISKCIESGIKTWSGSLGSS